MTIKCYSEGISKKVLVKFLIGFTKQSKTLKRWRKNYIFC